MTAPVLVPAPAAGPVFLLFFCLLILILDLTNFGPDLKILLP